MEPIDEEITYIHYSLGLPSPPSSPGPSTSRTMFWGLNQRIDGTERQTRELAIQSERQMKLIQGCEESQKEGREAMANLLFRIQNNEQSIVQLQNANAGLYVNQEQLYTNQQIFHTKQEALTAEVEALKEKVQVLEQRRQQQGTSGSVSELEVPGNEEQVFHMAADNNGPGGAIFTDNLGQKRRVCRYCGQVYGARYCNEHENKQICLRSLSRRRRPQDPRSLV